MIFPIIICFQIVVFISEIFALLFILESLSKSCSYVLFSVRQPPTVQQRHLCATLMLWVFRLISLQLVTANLISLECTILIFIIYLIGITHALFFSWLLFLLMLGRHEVIRILVVLRRDDLSELGLLLRNFAAHLSVDEARFQRRLYKRRALHLRVSFHNDAGSLPVWFLLSLLQTKIWVY